jgi:hypothetical protein
VNRSKFIKFVLFAAPKLQNIFWVVFVTNISEVGYACYPAFFEWCLLPILVVLMNTCYGRIFWICLFLYLATLADTAELEFFIEVGLKFGYGWYLHIKVLFFTFELIEQSKFVSYIHPDFVKRCEILHCNLSYDCKRLYIT